MLSRFPITINCATMADNEDDYLSDKFLVESTSTSSKPKTYAERRKEAQKQAQIKNEANRLKSRRQREQEAREEGLNKSLFERAKEEEAAGISTSNKALSMMMKMGFKPGQALGRSSEGASSTAAVVQDPDLLDNVTDSALGADGSVEEPKTVPQHKTEPIPLNEWMGTSLTV